MFRRRDWAERGGNRGPAGSQRRENTKPHPGPFNSQDVLLLLHAKVSGLHLQMPDVHPPTAVNAHKGFLVRSEIASPSRSALEDCLTMCMVTM